MSELFLAMALGCSALYILYRQRIDLFLVAFLANCLYGWQTIAGKVWVPPYEFPVTDNSRYILGIVFLGILSFSFLNDNIYKSWFRGNRYKFISNDGPSNVSSQLQYQLAYFLSVISFSIALILIFQAKFDLFFLGKTGLNLRYPLSQSFFLAMPAGVALVYGVYRKDYKLIFLGAVPILLYILIGFRSIAIVVIVSIIMLRSYQNRIISKKSIKMAGWVGLIFITFVVYKQAYIPLKEGNFDVFEDKVQQDSRFDSTAEFLLWAALSAEFGQVSSNLELTSSQDLSRHHSYSAVVLSSIPLLDSNDVGVTSSPRFSDTIMSHVNPGFSYGLGGTFWGENFVLGRFLGVCIAVLALGFFVLFAQILIFEKGYFIFLYIATNIVFLLPKMDLYAVLGTFKNVIILILIPIFLIGILRGLADFIALRR